ncbi:MAG TPA: caspase family protein [Thermotogota bacterium]|nr:caspase family protein [Thermotogota bacterium]
MKFKSRKGRRGGLWLLFLLVIVSCLAWSKTHALIIGVGEFNDPAITELPGAIRDAKQLGALLERQGIGLKEEGSLRVVLNPARGEILKEIFEWTQRGETGDQMILYYGGHGETQEKSGQTKTYWVPRDGYTAMSLREDTFLNFQEKVVPLLQNGLQGKQSLLILDACYSGSIIVERPVGEAKLELDGFAMLAEQLGIQVLVSAGEKERSKEREEGGGYFTHALIEGLKGNANANNDDTIEMGELGSYVEERVKRETENEQKPIYFGTLSQMVIARDPTRRTREILGEVTTLFSDGKIQAKHFLEYATILGQDSEKDTSVQGTIRKLLEEFYQNKNLDTLNTMTEKALGTSAEDTSVQTSTGTCFLTLVSGNSLVEGATIWIDAQETGEKMGSQGSGGVIFSKIAQGNHLVTIEKDDIQPIELDVKLDEADTLKVVTVEAEKAKRMVIIRTDPREAEITINGQKQTNTSPVMKQFEVGTSLEIVAAKPGYNDATHHEVLHTKGEPMELLISMEKNPSPGMPIKIERDSGPKTLTPKLEWMGNDPEGDPIVFDLFLREQGGTWQEVARDIQKSEYTLGKLEAATQYFWKVIVKDNHGNETEGVEWSFWTRD